MSYEVVYQDKYYLRELIESIKLKDSLDQISYQADITLKVTGDFPNIQPGQDIRISGVPFGRSDMVYLLNPGVVWECESSDKATKHMALTVYDRTIYLAKSEDEYLLPAGQTASQRIRKYAADWGIKLSTVPDTKTKLKKAVYRPRPIYNMITSDLQETVKSGGDMYIPRMTAAGLELYKIGSNKEVWILQGIEETQQKRTLEGTITKVKVIGTEDRKQTKQKKVTTELPSKILAIETGDTKQFGTLQRMIQDEDVKTTSAAQKLGKSMLSGVQETFTVKGLDLNTLRSGDAVNYNGLRLIVTGISHELGDPGHMLAELASEDYVRRRFFLRYA